MLLTVARPKIDTAARSAANFLGCRSQP